MRTKLILIALLAAVSAAIAGGQRLKWEFDRAANKFRFKFNEQPGYYYGVVRYDIKLDRYTLLTNYVATRTGEACVTASPFELSNEDSGPTPSGQCYFYLVEQKIGE
jgi:hypothetical protein